MSRRARNRVHMIATACDEDIRLIRVTHNRDHAPIRTNLFTIKGVKVRKGIESFVTRERER